MKYGATQLGDIVVAHLTSLTIRLCACYAGSLGMKWTYTKGFNCLVAFFKKFWKKCRRSGIFSFPSDQFVWQFLAEGSSVSDWYEIIVEIATK